MLVLLILTFLILCGASCSTEHEDPPFMSVSPREFHIDSEGGQGVISINTNVGFESHLDDNAKSWLSIVGVGSDEVRFEAEENSSVSARVGYLTFSYDQILEVVKIVQQGAVPFISLGEEQVFVGSFGGKIELSVATNIGYSVTVPDWIQKSDVLSAGNIQVFEVQANMERVARGGEIVFLSEQYGIEKILKISQAQRDVLEVSPDTFNIAFESQDFEVVVDANVDYDISYSNDWVDLQSVNDSILKFTAHKNTTKEIRKMQVVFSFGELSRAVTIVQQGMPSEIYGSGNGFIYAEE